MYLMGVVLCWNAASTILLAAGIQPNGPLGYGTGLSTLDAKQSLGGYQWNSFVFNDFVTGVLTVMNVAWDLIAAAPTLVLSAGVPAYIEAPLVGIWAFMWFMVVMMEWVAGRQV